MSPKNILIRMPNWLGDLVMATPLLTDLKEAFPKASLTAMCTHPISELLKKDRSIDELFSFQRPNNQFLRRKDARNIIAKIQEGHYDLGILAPNSFSSAWWFWWGGVAQRIGFQGHFRSLFLSHPLIAPSKKEREHQVRTYKRLLAPLGILPSDTAPRLFVTEEEKKAGEELLAQGGYQGQGKLVGIHPGAAYGSAKCWPPERFRELIEQLLLEDPKLQVVLIGDQRLQELVRWIGKDFSERVMDLCGKTPLRELAGLMQWLDVFVTNDSGPMHMAAALNVPLVALFGSTDEKMTGPYGQPEGVIRKPASCSPCFQRVCSTDFRCMLQIQVSEVLQKTLTLLEKGRV